MEKKIKENKKQKNKNSLLQIGLTLVGAILILIIIWTITPIDQLPPSPNTLQQLSETIKSASPSGQLFAGTFFLNKNNLIGINDLAVETNLSAESFIFTMGEFTNADGIETDGNYMKYIGTQSKKRLSAIIICKPTKSELTESLSNLDPKYDTSLASNGCKYDGIVCCVIIPTKAIS